MLDRVAAFFLNRLSGRQAGSAIAVIAVVAVGSFLGVRSGQHRTNQRAETATVPRVVTAVLDNGSAVADGAQSLIREQVEMGVAVRMAVLEALSRNLPNA